MKPIAIASIALLALAGAASADATNGLSSASEVTISTLAPQLDTASLTSVQVNRINNEVSSNDGLSQPELLTIISR